ncbi:MAG: glycosyltransferase family 39 protein, partial [Acidimicrobiia bacterium]
MRADADRAFRRRLVGITAAGIAIRIGLAFWYQDHTTVAGDGVYYLSVARLIARGVGYLEPVQYLGLHRRVPTAVHPPLYPLFLSAVDVVGFHGSLAHRLWSCGPSAVTIPVVGLVTKSLAGRRAGLAAAALAAVSISLAVQDVLLWSEGLYVMMTVVTVWCAYRALAHLTVRNAVFLAAAIAASALIRAEAALLIGLLLVPIIVRAGAGRHRVRLAVAALSTVVVVLVPWTAYNATRFDRPVITSTGLGPVLWSSNCDQTYYGPNTGGWYFICSRHRFSVDESVADGEQADVALRYIGKHTDRLPAVISV